MTISPCWLLYQGHMQMFEPVTQFKKRTFPILLKSTLGPCQLSLFPPHSRKPVSSIFYINHFLAFSLIYNLYNMGFIVLHFDLGNHTVFLVICFLFNVCWATVCTYNLSFFTVLCRCVNIQFIYSILYQWTFGLLSIFCYLEQCFYKTDCIPISWHVWAVYAFSSIYAQQKCWVAWYICL